MKAVLLAVLLAGCAAPAATGPLSDRPECPGEPFHVNGPVTIRVGYGVVFVANETNVLRFQVPTEANREWCQMQTDLAVPRGS